MDKNFAKKHTLARLFIERLLFYGNIPAFGREDEDIFLLVDTASEYYVNCMGQWRCDDNKQNGYWLNWCGAYLSLGDMRDFNNNDDPFIGKSNKIVAMDKNSISGVFYKMMDKLMELPVESLEILANDKEYIHDMNREQKFGE